MRILYNRLEVPHAINTKLGELIYNKHDKILYTKDKYMNIIKIALGSGNGVKGKDGKDGKDGVSFNIQGTDTYANIINKPNPKKGDMWIASDRAGHGIVWNGLRWTDVGKIQGDKGDKGDRGVMGSTGSDGVKGDSAYQVWLSQGHSGSTQDFFKFLEGQQGVQGQKGIQGTGIHFENSYATKADMVAANPNPAIGDTHLVTGTGDMWTWDNPNPPHDPAGAIWNDIGHVAGPQGNAGVQGIQGVPGHDGHNGIDGKDGSPLQLATTAETTAGTVHDKANTPQGTRAAYVPRAGGTFHGQITVKDDGTNFGVTLSGRSSLGSFIKAQGAVDTIRFNAGGGIDLVPTAGKPLDYRGDEIATIKYTTALATKYLPLTGGDIDGILKVKATGHGAFMYFSANSTVGSYITSNAGATMRFNNNGNIDLTPKAGAKATYRGRNILTGKLTGHTLHLNF